MKLFPGVKKRLNILKLAGYTLAICTSRHTETTLRILDWFKITKFFSLVVGINSVQHPKPYPDGIDKIIRLTKSEKKSTVMIGDHPIDMKMAENAKISSIGVRSGGHQDADLQNHNLFTIVDSVDNITPDLLKTLFSN